MKIQTYIHLADGKYYHIILYSGGEFSGGSLNILHEITKKEMEDLAAIGVSYMIGKVFNNLFDK